MIELELENALVEIIARATDGQDAALLGAWNPAPRGHVKSSEGASNAPITCYVRIAPRSFSTYGVTTPIFQASVTTRLRSDLDPASQSFAVFVGAMTDAFSRLNQDVDIENAITVPGLQVTAFNLQGGEAPTYDEATGCWFVTQQIQIVGVFADA